MERMKNLLMPREWMSRWYGRRGEEERREGRVIIWHADPKHHDTDEIPPPPPKKSCMDRTRNAIARAGHWRSVVYFNRSRNGGETGAGFATSAR